MFAYEIVLLKESVDNLTNLQNVYSDIFFFCFSYFYIFILRLYGLFWAVQSNVGGSMRHRTELFKCYFVSNLSKDNRNTRPNSI